MNWRTIFFTSILLCIFFTHNSAVADESVADNIAECNDLRSECLDLVADIDLAIKTIIDMIYDKWLKSCDKFYKRCIKAARKARGRLIPGSGWVLCQQLAGYAKVRRGFGKLVLIWREIS